jgi:hypothetical protein
VFVGTFTNATGGMGTNVTNPYQLWLPDNVLTNDRQVWCKTTRGSPLLLRCSDSCAYVADTNPKYPWIGAARYVIAVPSPEQPNVAQFA